MFSYTRGAYRLVNGVMALANDFCYHGQGTARFGYGTQNRAIVSGRPEGHTVRLLMPWISPTVVYCRGQRRCGQKRGGHWVVVTGPDASGCGTRRVASPLGRLSADRLYQCAIKLADGRFSLVSDDHTLRLWDAATGDYLATLGSGIHIA